MNLKMLCHVAFSSSVEANMRLEQPELVKSAGYLNPSHSLVRLLSVCIPLLGLCEEI